MTLKEKERIHVFVDIVNGRTVCICTARNKGCKKQCERDVVERDLFRGWDSTMRDKYGR
jgi:hypothetical protein